MIFLSCTVLDIYNFEDFRATTLTLRGYVTSSVTWLLDSQYERRVR